MGKVPGNRRSKRVRTSSEHSNSASPEPAETPNNEFAKELKSKFSADLDYDFSVDWGNLNEQGDIFGFQDFNGDVDSFLSRCETETVAAQTSSNTNSDFPTPSSSEFRLRMLDLSFGIDETQSPTATDDHENVPASSSVLKAPAALHRQPQNLHFSRSAQSDAPTQVCTPSFPPTPPLIPERRHSSCSQCMLACTKLIDFLDLTIQDDSKGVDDVMRVNRASVCEITRIMNTAEYRDSASCPLLISVVMGQIISLFESSIRSEGFPPSNLILPRLRFGSFQVDPQEQITLRVHIICKELQRCSQALKVLCVTMRNRSTQVVQSGSLHKQWSADMARRLEALIAAVEGTWR